MTGDPGASNVLPRLTGERRPLLPAGRPPAVDGRVPLALAMALLGQGTLDDVRACGLDGDLRDLARAAKALPELAIALTPEGFRCDASTAPIDRALPRISQCWADLSLRALRVLCDRGDYHRVAEVVGAVMDVVDVRPVVFRHAFDLLNAGEVELVESLVFDDAFGAPEWLRDALSAIEGILWSGFRGYRAQVKRAREVQVAILAEIVAARRRGEDVVPMAQAWALLDHYASWGEVVPVVSELPSDLVDDADRLLRCLWTLRRGRQLMALGHLEAALRLLEAAQGLVARASILGAHLDLDRFLCLILGGHCPDETELRRVRGASRFANAQRLDLLSLSIDGYVAAALAYTEAGSRERAIERLAERSELHPDPFLRAFLAIGCAVDAYRRHSFYAALTYVRDLSSEVRYLGATDLTCCAYAVEALCQGAVGEELRPIGDPEEGRPSVLGLLPLARTIYGETQEVFALARELDPGSPAPFDEGVPSYVASVLADLALRGTWVQSSALRALLPLSWQEAPQRPLVPSGPTSRERHRPSGRERSDEGDRDGASPLPRVRLGAPTVPKLTLRMLGCFEVWVGDRKVTDDCWRRKAGKTVIQALIVVPSHSLSRADLCEILWPDRDYLLSRNGLYSVLSSTREAIGSPKAKPGYLICERGRVALNGRLTECDVDAFQRRCREVLSHQGDRPWRLSVCRDLGRRYNGGLYMPAQDVRGDFQARRQSLESLYVDVLVEAAGLALKMGRAKEALWYANDAAERQPLREDVVACRLRALAADGRGRELAEVYRHYCGELSDGLYAIPSARIRALHANLTRYVQEAVVPEDGSFRGYEEAFPAAA